MKDVNYEDLLKRVEALEAKIEEMNKPKPTIHDKLDQIVESTKRINNVLDAIISEVNSRLSELKADDNYPMKESNMDARMMNLGIYSDSLKAHHIPTWEEEHPEEASDSEDREMDHEMIGDLIGSCDLSQTFKTIDGNTILCVFINNVRRIFDDDYIKVYSKENNGSVQRMVYSGPIVSLRHFKEKCQCINDDAKECGIEIEGRHDFPVNCIVFIYTKHEDWPPEKTNEKIESMSIIGGDPEVRRISEMEKGIHGDLVGYSYLRKVNFNSSDSIDTILTVSFYKNRCYYDNPTYTYDSVYFCDYIKVISSEGKLLFEGRIKELRLFNDKLTMISCEKNNCGIVIGGKHEFPEGCIISVYHRGNV